MHREFCTLLDSNYLFKAVALHRSLLEHCESFHLTAFCFDEEVEAMFERLALPNLSTVSLAQLEAHDPELLSVKDDRTPVEYCWTSTPALPLYMLQTRPELDEVTYLDADLMFFADPEPIFGEMGGASVLITPHRYAPEYAEREINGIYNVQFMTFRRDDRGMEALQWWHDRCIEWCYYRLEDGKLGDQKYLDDWPERFEGVHVLRLKGGGLAPWNITRYDLRRDGRRVWVDGDELIFFHYHRVKVMGWRSFDWRPPGYPIDEYQYELVYRPYLKALRIAIRQVRLRKPGFRAGMDPKPPLGERIADLRLRFGTAVVRRAPFMERVRHPRGRPPPR